MHHIENLRLVLGLKENSCSYKEEVGKGGVSLQEKSSPIALIKGLECKACKKQDMVRLKLLLVVCMLLWCELIVVNYLEVHDL